MKLLVTGFDAFGKESLNPASQVLPLLMAPEGVELLKLEIPTVYGCGAQVLKVIEKEKPRAVLLLGQAGGRSSLTLERVAINLRDCSMADNAGKTAQEEPVLPDGPAAYFSTLPIKTMVSAIQAAGIPAAVSNTAGTFVCNSLLYEVLHGCSQIAPDTKVGFLHVPFLPCQVTDRPQFPGMSLGDMAKGISAALASL